MRYPGRPGRRRGWTHPDIAGFLTGTGLDVLDIPTGLAPRALRDIRAGQATGRFTVPEAEIALSAAAGARSGCCGCASGTQPRHRDHRRPARRGRAAAAGRPPPTRPPALSPPFRTPGPGGCPGWLLPTVWTGLTGWGQARCGPRRSGRQRADCRGQWWYRVLRRGRPGAAGADAGRGIRFVFFQGLPVQEGPGQPVQPVPAAAQGGQCLLVALLDDPPGFGVGQLSGGGGDTVGGLVLAGGKSSRPELIRSGVLFAPGGLRGLLRPAGSAGTPPARARAAGAAVRAWLRGRPGWRRTRRRWRRARSARAGR